ncbi:MAG: Bro-N domain-containing protein [Bacteroidota bacterium]
MADNQLIQFESKEIRRIWHQEEWYYSIIDIIEAITASKNARRYWSDLKRKLTTEGFAELYEKIVQLKMEASDGKMRNTDTASKETAFRIIQSIPSPKAEKFKQWLAKVGSERIDEIENPDLIAQRFREHYRNLGYGETWIDTRWQSILTRAKLTDEWKDRGVREGKEYAILTAIISEETFGLKPSDHKKIKGLKRENLRDHMSNLELIFTMLGEESTRREAVRNDHKGFDENKIAARKGGSYAGEALKTYEEQSGEKVVSDINYKEQIKAAKKEQRRLARENKKKRK